MGGVNAVRDAFQIFGVPDKQALRCRWDEITLQNTGRPPEPREGTLKPYVNWGRWVADCPACRAGIALVPGNDEACCMECGSLFSGVSFPRNRGAVEALLQERVEWGQGVGLTSQEIWSKVNWYPESERAEDIRAQNELHLIGLDEIRKRRGK